MASDFSFAAACGDNSSTHGSGTCFAGANMRMKTRVGRCVGHTTSATTTINPAANSRYANK
eukprot:6206961-Pleurochrysis_carterae.AAC.3